MRGPARRQGGARRIAASKRLRLGQLPADGGDPRHARRCAIRADAQQRLFHQHRARPHSRRSGACRGPAKPQHRRRRPRRLGDRAAAARPPAAATRQRAGEPAHRRRHQGNAPQHGQDRCRAGPRRDRRQTGQARSSIPTCGRSMRGGSSGCWALRRRPDRRDADACRTNHAAFTPPRWHALRPVREPVWTCGPANGPANGRGRDRPPASCKASKSG